MKKLLTILMLLKLTYSDAQFYAGSQGMTVKTGTDFSFENLSLRPSSDLTIVNNALQKTGAAIPFSPHASITRVYRFGSPITFTGTASITFLTTELNGNTENTLQILYSPGERQPFILTTTSTVNQFFHRVANVFSNTNLLTISAASPGGPLPVTLVDFTVRAEGEAAVLTWSTSSELNADRFEIQRSGDAKNWMPTGMENAYGDSNLQQTYKHTETDLSQGTTYFRLKMIDKDGSFAYSQIRSLLMSATEKPSVFPNPVADKLFLQNIPGGAVTISVYAISGRLVAENRIMPGDGLAVQNLSAGIYILKIKPENGQSSTHTFVKQ